MHTPRAFDWRVALVIGGLINIFVGRLSSLSSTIYFAGTWGLLTIVVGVLSIASAIRWTTVIGRLVVALTPGLFLVRSLSLILSVALNPEIEQGRGPLTSSFVYLGYAYFYLAVVITIIIPGAIRSGVKP